MEIIQTELRLKDIEWVEKHLEGLKRTGRSLGSSSLADKARREEIVRLAGKDCVCSRCRLTL
jgi:obg-like ATPase 1